MNTPQLTRRALTALLFLAAMLLLPVAASASTTGDTMPWDQGLTVIMNALSGNTVKIIGVIMIIGAGLLIAFSEGAAIKRVAWIVVGLGIALNAASFLTLMFPNASGHQIIRRATDFRPILSLL